MFFTIHVDLGPCMVLEISRKWAEKIRLLWILIRVIIVH